MSVRTLHYYDEIGLLKPACIKENGYRCYEEKQLFILEQIMLFKELEFPLGRIEQIMGRSEFDELDALSDQHKLLKLKKERTEKILKIIVKKIKTLQGGNPMSDDTTFSVFNDPTYQKYKNEVEQRWGNTDAYKQSMQRIGKLSKSDLARIKAEGGEITSSIAALMKKGFSHDSSEVQKQMERYFKYLHHFYDPSYEMFKGLGQMYVDDPRFTKYYEKIAHGLARFICTAMGSFSDAHDKGNS